MSGKIKVACKSCGARYKVRDNKVRGHRFRATCKRCGGIIEARGEEEHSREHVVQAPVLDLRTTGKDENISQVNDACWYVVIEGKPHGPLTTIQVGKSVAAGQIDRQSYLWRTGDAQWRHLSEVPEFVDIVTDPRTRRFQAEAAVDGPQVRSTRETRAATPQGYRRMGQSLNNGRPEQERPEEHRMFFDQEEELPSPSDRALDDEPTRLHKREEDDFGEAGSRADYYGAAPLAFEPPPQVPPRKAMLPAPDGTLPSLEINEPEAPPPASFLAPDPPAPVEKIADLAARQLDRLPPNSAPKPAARPALPALPINGGPPLPVAPIRRDDVLPAPDQGSSLGSDVLEGIVPLGGPTPFSPNVLLPLAAKESFWTTGKIAALAAIGGGLSVAITIVLVVSVAQPKRVTVVTVPGAATVKGDHGSHSKAAMANTSSNPARRSLTPPAKPPPEQSTTNVSPTPPKAASAASDEDDHQDKGETKEKDDVEDELEDAEDVALQESQEKKIAEKKRRLAKDTPIPPRRRRRTRAIATSRRSQSSSEKKPSAPAPARPEKKRDALDVDDLIAGAVDTMDKKTSKKKAARAASDQQEAMDTDDLLDVGGSKKGGGAKEKVDTDELLTGLGSKKKEKAMTDGKRTATAEKKPAPVLPVKPTQGQVQAVIRRAMIRIRGCHDKYRKDGMVTVRFTVQGSGMAQVTISGQFAGTPTGFCVLGAVERLKFPQFSGPPITFNYPVQLK